MTPVYRLRIEPAGYEIPASHNATVLEAANAAGYFWPVGCNRNGECTNCAMHIISGLGRVSPIGRYERQNLIRQRGPRSIEDPRLRLACQAHILGDLIVHKSGVYPDPTLKQEA